MVKRTHYAWLLVALLWVVGMLNYLDRQVIFSLFPLLRAEFQVSDAQLGLVTPAFLWVYGALSPFGGYLADRFSRSKIILVSLFVWSAVTWATGHVSGFGQMLGARALMGISEACYIPAALALLADHHGERTRSLATGLHQSGLYVGMIAGGWAGGWLGQQYGWRAAFTWLGLAGLVYAVVLILGLREGQSETPVEQSVAPTNWWAALGGLLSNRDFLLLGAAFTLFSVAGWIVLTWLPLYLYERFQMTLAGAGFSATFYIQAAAFAGILGGGVLADRWSRTNPRARVLVPVAGFAAGGVFLFMVGWTSSPLILSVCLVVYGLSRGLLDCTAMPILCQIAPVNLRATGYGLFNLAGCIVGGTMAALAGALKGAIGLGGALQVSAVLLLIAAAVLWRVQPQEQPHTQAAMVGLSE